MNVPRPLLPQKAGGHVPIFMGVPLMRHMPFGQDRRFCLYKCNRLIITSKELVHPGSVFLYVAHLWQRDRATLYSLFSIVVQLYFLNVNIALLSHPLSDFMGSVRALHLSLILVIT